MEGCFGRLKNELFHGRNWSGVSAEEFARRLVCWLSLRSRSDSCCEDTYSLDKVMAHYHCPDA